MLFFVFLFIFGFAPGWSFESHYSVQLCRFISRFENGLFIHDYTTILLSYFSTELASFTLPEI